MKHSAEIFFLFVVCFFAVFAQSCKPKEKQQKANFSQPNINWLMAEDIGTDLECYGTAAVRTPFLNQLAQEGVLYTKTYSTSSICSPNCSAMRDDQPFFSQIQLTVTHRGDRNSGMGKANEARTVSANADG